jgi:hypothetical protein
MVVVELQPEEDGNTNSVSGIARFSSQNHFDASMQTLINYGKLPNDIKDYVSINDAVSLKSGEVDEEEYDTLIYSDVIKEVLNENYEIIIGEIYFKITKEGTFFTPLTNSQWLREATFSDDILTDCVHVTSALGYFEQEGIYKIAEHDKLYVYDTFRKISPITNSTDINIEFTKSASMPGSSDWDDISDSQTLFGKGWDSLWGFTKSERNYFDSEHRVDVKFYAQKILFFSEIGIKTKTQKKGWTGLWRKQNCDEILNGWEMLNLKEKWNQSYFGPAFEPDNSYRPKFYYEDKVAQDLAYTQSVFLSKTWKTFNIWGKDIDFSQKQKVQMFWNTAKAAGKVGTSTLNGMLANPASQREAIRIIPEGEIEPTTTKVSIGPYSERRTSTDKHTSVISNGSGGVVSVTFGGGNGFGFNGYQSLSAKFTFLESTVMYGAARRGNTWRGVRITF